MTRNVRYRALRERMIQFFAQHYLPPENVVESSLIANQLNEFAAEMDSIAADALLELEDQILQHSDVPRTTEVL